MWFYYAYACTHAHAGIFGVICVTYIYRNNKFKFLCDRILENQPCILVHLTHKIFSSQKQPLNLKFYAIVVWIHSIDT